MKGIERKGTALQLIAILSMWASTVAYLITVVLLAVQTFAALQDLLSRSQGHPDASDWDSDIYENIFRRNWARRCVGTAALTINVGPSFKFLAQSDECMFYTGCNRRLYHMVARFGALARKSSAALLISFIAHTLVWIRVRCVEGIG